MWRRARFTRARRAAYTKTRHPSLRHLYESRLPEPKTHWRDAEFVAIDVETTGINLVADTLLSVGWVPVLEGRVRPSQGGYCVVRSSEPVGQSATVHGLTDTVVQSGLDEDAVFSKLVAALHGRVAIMHHAPLDVAMLNRLSERVAHAPLILPVIDTLRMAQARQRFLDTPLAVGALRLDAARKQVGLPRYEAHHSQIDAMATAELFCALLMKRFGDRARIRDLWPK